MYNQYMSYRSEMEALVLGALRDGPLHGYRIAQSIHARSDGLLKMGDNQIYPTLHRLELEGLVSAEWHQQEGKPARKTYALTKEGDKRLEFHREEWERYATHFAAVIGAKVASNV